MLGTNPRIEGYNFVHQLLHLLRTTTEVGDFLFELIDLISSVIWTPLEEIIDITDDKHEIINHHVLLIEIFPDGFLALSIILA